MISIAICIITYKRTASLVRTLQSLAALKLPEEVWVKFVVVDNDVAESARDVVNAENLPIEYVVEEKKGIPHARNRALQAAANDDYIAFIDDDDIADPLWLSALYTAAIQYQAEVVKGQVIYRFDDDQLHLAGLDIFAPTNLPTGSALDNAWTNNVLFSTRIYKNSGLKFDTIFTNTGGSDSHFFCMAKKAGAKIIFCAEAVVYSLVPRERCRSPWIMRRAMRVAATMTISDVKCQGHGYAAKQVLRATGDSACYAYRLFRGACGGTVPFIHPAMIVAHMVGRVAGLLRISPREYQ